MQDKNEVRTLMLAFRMSPSELKVLRQAAKKEHVPPGTLARMIIMKELGK